MNYNSFFLLVFLAWLLKKYVKLHLWLVLYFY